MIAIISAGTPDYRDMMAENRRRCEALGYRYVAHDLDPSTDLEGALPPCTFKPELMAKFLYDLGDIAAMEQFNKHEVYAWMDADAIVVRPLDDLLSIDFDVAVTLRAGEEIGTTQPTTNYLNAGVVFFRNTPAARVFVADWIEQTRHTRNDQAALNLLVGTGWENCGWHSWTDYEWRESYDTTIMRGGLSVHVLPANEWTFSSWGGRPPADVRILHFKHGWRELRGPQWWKEELCRTEQSSAPRPRWNRTSPLGRYN